MNYIGLILAVIALAIPSLGYAGKIPKKYENASFLIGVLSAIVLICMYGYKIPVK